MIDPAAQPLVGYRVADLQFDGVLTLDGGIFVATGWIAEITFSDYPGSSSHLTLATNTSPTPAGSSFIWSNAALGDFSLLIRWPDWASFPPEVQNSLPVQFHYNIVLTDPLGIRGVYVVGQLTLNAG